MKMVCPSCGAVHSAEAWSSDPDIRQCLVLVANMPRGIARRVFPYIALFRPERRSLTWSRTLRLLSEINEMVSEAMIQWKKEPARPNSVRAWEEAMEQVISNPPALLPLKSHGYLRRIVYDRANQMDRTREAAENKRIAAGHGRPARDSADLKPFSVPVEVMREIRKKSREKFQQQEKTAE